MKIFLLQCICSTVAENVVNVISCTVAWSSSMFPAARALPLPEAYQCWGKWRRDGLGENKTPLPLKSWWLMMSGVLFLINV